MHTINEIYEYLCELAPLELQMGFDNSGFQLGRKISPVSRVMLALDVTDDVVAEAINLGCELIVSHHPLIFHAVKKIDGSDPEGERQLTLIENNIAVISMHTNLDIADGGVNDVLIRMLGAEPEAALDEGCGRIGELEAAIELPQFLDFCKAILKVNGLRYYDAGRSVRKIAVMGGAGGDSLDIAFEKGCDTYLTSDIKYHQFLRAAELKLNLIDADHFCTENPIIPVLHKTLSDKFSTIEFYISQRHKQIVFFA